MNHLYHFINSGSPWSALTLDVSTGRDEGHQPERAKVCIRRAATKLETHYTASELRFIAVALMNAAEALEVTARNQHDAYLDRRAA
jgi:hypothetical protein